LKIKIKKCIVFIKNIFYETVCVGRLSVLADDLDVLADDLDVLAECSTPVSHN
jgi:hypothetical protein